MILENNNVIDFNSLEENGNSQANSLEQSNHQSSSLGQWLRDYFEKTYEFKLDYIRCQKSGIKLEEITDSKLELLYNLSQKDLSIFCDKLEMIISNSPTSLLWLIETEDSLMQLKSAQPLGFFCYAIQTVLNTSLMQEHSKRNSLTTTGRFLRNSDLYLIAQTAEQANKRYAIDWEAINDKMILLLAIGGGKAISVADLVTSLETNSLQTLIDKVYNQLLNNYRIAHKLSFNDKLSYQDIQRINRQAKLEAERQKQIGYQRDQERQARLSQYWQATKLAKLKKATKSKWLSAEDESMIDSLLTEIQLANNDRQNYITSLNTAKANAIDNNKLNSLENLNQLYKESIKKLNRADDSSATKLMPIKLALKLTTIKGATNND